jgi:nucleoside-diphosphate-sugar epimerase
MGPSLASGDALSEGFAKGIVEGTTKSLTKKAMGFVDVRDCADAHLQGVKVAEAANKRFLLAGESLWFREAAEIIKAEYGPRGFPVTTTEDAEGETHCSLFNHSQAEKVLGIKFTPMKQSLKDMIESMIADGKIKVPETK